MVVKRKLEIPVFAGRATRRFDTLTGFFILIGIFCLLQRVLIGRWYGIQIFFVSIAVLLVGIRLLRKPLENCICRFGENDIERVIFGYSTKISYQEIADALQTKKIKVTMTSFKVPKKHGYIVFHYEVGALAVQEHVLDSYHYLCEKIESLHSRNLKPKSEVMPWEAEKDSSGKKSEKSGVPKEDSFFPEMTKRLIGQMDQSWFYKKMRWSSSFWMIATSWMCVFVGVDMEVGLIFVIGVMLILQYTQIKTLFKSIYFGKKIEEKIQAVFENCRKADLRKVHVTYLQLFGMTFAMMMCNLFWIVIAME